MASIYLTTVDIAERTGGNLRQLRLLADAGALQAIPDTQHGGRGVHRLFPQSELTVAAILVALAPFRLPIGALTDIAKIIRSLDRHIATAGWPVEMPHHEKALSWIGEGVNGFPANVVPPGVTAVRVEGEEQPLKRPPWWSRPPRFCLPRHLLFASKAKSSHVGPGAVRIFDSEKWRQERRQSSKELQED